MLSRINKRLAAMSKGARKLANGGLVAVWDEDGVAGVLKGDTDSDEERPLLTLGTADGEREPTADELKAAVVDVVRNLMTLSRTVTRVPQAACCTCAHADCVENEASAYYECRLPQQPRQGEYDHRPQVKSPRVPDEHRCAKWTCTQCGRSETATRDGLADVKGAEVSLETPAARVCAYCGGKAAALAVDYVRDIQDTIDYAAKELCPKPQPKGEASDD